MASRKFTEEEMAQLRNNEYVLEVTPNTVHFSAVFKEFFWDELLKGKEAEEIARECGLDPEILGTTRLSGLKSMIRKPANKKSSPKQGLTEGKSSRQQVGQMGNTKKPPQSAGLRCVWRIRSVVFL